jgi:hypothetical protein
MADIIPFDLAGSLQAHNAIVQQRQQLQAQNALTQAVPLLQSDPQNAFATAARTSPQAALQLIPYIKQMADEKKAALADRADALGKLAYTLKSQYPDPVIRKAVAMSQAQTLAAHGITPDQIQNYDYSDQNLQATINQAQTVSGLISQSNADRTFEQTKQVHADTLKQQDRTYGLQAAEFGEKKRHDMATEAADGADAGGGLNDAAKVNAAVKYNLTGTLPPFGMGKAARADRLEVLNYAAQMASGKKTAEQLVADAAGFKSNSRSLDQQTKQFNAIEQNANTAKNSLNLAIASASAGGAGGTDSPVLNRWIQAGRVAISGDPQVKALQNHLSAFAEDYAKVMTANTSAAGATDRAAAEAHQRLNAAYSVDSLKQIAGEMLKEMGGRHYAARAQMESIRGQLAGGTYKEPQGVETAAPAGTIPPPPPGFVVHK